MDSERREIASQLAQSHARLYCTAAEVQRLADELPRLARGDREWQRHKLAQQCRRLLSEASTLSDLLDRSESRSSDAT